ncbi:unnamed protein product [Callosobruchus maculatus]|uniref:Heparan-alpha-glucosaminide N-acetyltransferase catalytic domain-containing protein n=3 Tax=Callosobruchus maculatus TaxID=64391 RepID=A0A653D1H0_CALMS|nr:unnamed protein product [Callosobruchus maculatus]
MTWYFIDEPDEYYFGSYDLTQLKTDQFYLDVNFSSFDDKIHLYYLNEECVGCPYLLKPFNNGVPLTTNLKLKLANTYQNFLPQDQTENVVCDLDHNFGQFGVYGVQNVSNVCELTVLKEAVNINTAIIPVIAIYTILILFGCLIVGVWRKCKKDSEDDHDKNKEKGTTKMRVGSLDTFRGFIIVMMIFANFGCGNYEYLNHAIWNGLHFADLIFPSFVWIMGVCIPISLASMFKKNLVNRELMLTILKRSAKLFLLGVFLGGGVDLSYLRIFGVLQRFGIAYLVVSLICILTMDRSSPDIDSEIDEPSRLKLYFSDILRTYVGWIFVIIITALHTIIIFSVAAPGCPSGYLGPGGLHQNRSYQNCTGGATGYIDGLILGNHRYQHPTIYRVYEARPFDPEGVVGCLTTILQAYLGVQAGVTLLVYKKHSERLFRWLLWGIGTGLAGGALCGFSKEDGIIPVNKNLWSLSFVLVTSCFAFTFLSLCYVLVDYKKLWTGKPFLFAGMNAILMYIGHEMTENHFPVRWYPHNEYSEDHRHTHYNALLSDTWGAAFWLFVSYYLYKIKYFLVI